ncbi:MAG: putative ATP-binding protein involved in virulence, partial [Saprospiraceae bacterium]
MKIKQLDLENFRGFEEKHTVVFHEELPTVIIGVNASGKTTIVDALFQLLSLHILRMFPISGENLSYSSSDITVRKEKCSLSIDYAYSKNRNLKKGHLGTNFSRLTGELPPMNTNDKFNQHIKDILYGTNENLLPIFLYFPAARNTATEEFSELNDTKFGRDKRLNIFRRIYQDTIDFSRLTEWYIEQENIQNKERVSKKDYTYTSPRFAAISDGINSFLTVFLGEDYELSLGEDEEGSQIIVVIKNEKQLQFNQLSAGEKMMFGLVFEIIYRMSIGNPKAENLLLTAGIVLIDEIELHLHPKWQVNILTALHQTFPNVQFIITTHSPLVINNLRKEQLVIIDNAKVLQGDKIAEVYGKDAGWIIEYLMGVPTRP